MIRVCILAVPGEPLKELLEQLGFQVAPINDCDVILADSLVVGVDINVPVVLYTKQEDLRHVITEAVVAERFKPLTDSVQECLNICNKE